MKQNIIDYLTSELGLPVEAVPEFYDTFLNSLAECLGQLREADGPTPDYLAIRRATHTIKGFARNVGANDLGDAAVALNAAAHAADAPACSLGIRDIESMYIAYRDA